MPELLSPLLSPLFSLYPALAQVRPALGSAELPLAVLEVPAGHVLFDTHAACAGFPLLLDGEVKVARTSGDGRSLELYRIVAGELCLVSCASLFHAQPLAAQAVTTRATRLLLIAPPTFARWLETPAFRDLVLGLFAQRMADLAALVDAVAFQRLDQRLAAALLGRGPDLALTHQDLADELGTVREIVSRLLRRFEREDWVLLAREHIQIRNSAALRALAAHAPPAV